MARKKRIETQQEAPEIKQEAPEIKQEAPEIKQEVSEVKRGTSFSSFYKETPVKPMGVTYG